MRSYRLLALVGLVTSLIGVAIHLYLSYPGTGGWLASTSGWLLATCLLWHRNDCIHCSDEF